MAWYRRQRKVQQRLEAIPQAAAVVLKGVDVRREGREVLSAIDLLIDERRVGIVGDNGSGKSTLARLFNGLLLPDAGDVEIYGHNSAYSGVSRLPALVGFLFQNPDHQILFPTVLEEMAFGLQQLSASQLDAQTLCREYLASHGCQDWADRPAQSLSEGEKQRLCLWSVLLMKPKLLVLDESFSSLDIRTRFSIMAELERQDLQIVMISHELELLERFDRVIWLHHGRIEADGEAAQVLAAYRQYARAAT